MPLEKDRQYGFMIDESGHRRLVCGSVRKSKIGIFTEDDLVGEMLKYFFAPHIPVSQPGRLIDVLSSDKSHIQLSKKSGNTS